MNYTCILYALIILVPLQLLRQETKQPSKDILDIVKCKQAASWNDNKHILVRLYQKIVCLLHIVHIWVMSKLACKFLKFYSFHCFCFHKQNYKRISMFLINYMIVLFNVCNLQAYIDTRLEAIDDEIIIYI